MKHVTEIKLAQMEEALKLMMLRYGHRNIQIVYGSEGQFIKSDHMARRSAGDPVPATKKWPWNCFIQCGDSGVVLSADGDYTTAFWEAFPDDTFIRGEGVTVLEAEAAAWEKYQRQLACDGHVYEKRGYKNGCGFCVKCNRFGSGVFPKEDEAP